MGRPGWVASWAEAQRGGVGSFFLFVFLFLSFSFYYFFSVLISFKVFRHFVKAWFLHHKYLSINWHTPNILVLMFENFYCLPRF